MTEQEVIDVEATEIVPYHAPAPVTLFRSDEPTEIVTRATETAQVLAQVVRKQKLTTTISGREHVRVEGWTLLGSMLGVFPVCTWTRKLENGWEARVEARTRTGEVVGAAEAECLRSEKTWANRDDYALRSMAQTRATSKALRQPLGFVMTLAGFDPTPLEEMSHEQSAGEPRGRKRTASAPPPAAAEASSEERAAASPAEISDAAVGESAVSGSASSPLSGEPERAASESPFKAPTGPRGGQATLIEAGELAAELVALVEILGATDSLPMIEEKRAAGDVAWLKRQIATAKKAVERRAAEAA